MKSNSQKYGLGVVLAFTLLAAAPSWAQMPNPPVLRTEAKATVPVDREIAVAVNDYEVSKDKTAFPGKSLGAVNEKETSPLKPGEALPKTKAQTDPDDGWQFGIAPYLWFPSIEGTIGARGRSLVLNGDQDPEGDYGGIFDYLDFALAGTFEARKGRFLFVNDFQWVRLSADRDTPGGLYNNAKIGFNYVLIDPEVGYRALDGPAGSLDVLGGVRIWSVENTLTVTSGRLPGFGVAERKVWAAPVIGARGTLNLSPRFFLTGKMDVGAGPDTGSTSQAFGAAGFKFTPWFAMLGGYRYLQVDHEDDRGFIFDTSMKGFIAGAKFTF